MKYCVRHCVACGKSFAPVMKRHIYCSPKCRERIKKREQRLRRQKQGLCPQCGREMDYPVRVGSGKTTGMQKISYCSRCREKFEELKAQKRLKPKTDGMDA